MVSFAAFSSRSKIAIEAPAEAKDSDIARPIPEPPPVTIAIFFESWAIPKFQTEDSGKQWLSRHISLPLRHVVRYPSCDCSCRNLEKNPDGQCFHYRLRSTALIPPTSCPGYLISALPHLPMARTRTARLYEIKAWFHLFGSAGIPTLLGITYECPSLLPNFFY